MKRNHLIYILFVVVLLSCAVSNNETKEDALQAGFRYSSYGPSYNPGPEYWPYVGEQMSAKFPGSRPAALWIVGIVDGDGTYLNLPCETEDPHIRCGYVDMNKDILDAFDKKGYDVWLQVEPGNASIDELIDIVLDQYKHHPSVVGFGIDVEWYKSTGGPEGQPITDEEAKRWVSAIRKHDRDYQLFLKHWDENWMPPTVRDGIMFVNDIQQGTFLKYYFRPLNMMFYYMSEMFDLKGLTQLLVGIGLLIYSSIQLNIDWTSTRLILLFVTLFSAALVQISIVVTASCAAFWVLDSFPVLGLAWKLREFSPYPMTIFDGAFRFAFTYVIPIGFVAFYPSQLFLRPQDVSPLVYFSPIIGMGLFTFTYWIWKQGINSYTGTGS